MLCAVDGYAFSQEEHGAVSQVSWSFVVMTATVLRVEINYLIVSFYSPGGAYSCVRFKPSQTIRSLMQWKSVTQDHRRDLLKHVLTLRYLTLVRYKPKITGRY